MLGVWLQQDGGWGKQVKELCKKAYRRMSLLTKLRYAGVERKELVHNYKQFIRTALEYCSVAMHSSLTEVQSSSLEHCQAVALRVILQDDHLSYETGSFQPVWKNYLQEGLLVVWHLVLNAFNMRITRASFQGIQTLGICLKLERGKSL